MKFFERKRNYVPRVDLVQKEQDFLKKKENYTDVTMNNYEGLLHFCLYTQFVKVITFRTCNNI